MSFLVPLARAAASVAGKGRLSAFMLGKSMGNEKSEEQTPVASNQTITDVTGEIK